MKLYLTLVLSLVWVMTLGQENLYDLKSSKKYANYLLSSGQYEASISEFERIVFLDKADLVSKQSLLKSYRLGKQYEKGVSRVPHLFNKVALLPKPHAVEYTKLLLSAKKWDQARSFWAISEKLPSEDKVLFETTLNIFESDFVKAQNTLNSLQLDSNVLYQSYASIIDRGINGKRKSPIVAGLLSTAIPGLGKVYTGDWKDAIVSLIFTGGLAFQAYRNFSNHGVNDFRPWAYTAIGTGFYIGNIVGSVKSSKDKNRKHINLLQHEASDYFNSYY